MNDINTLYAALLEAVNNSSLIAKEIDAEFGTTLASEIPTLPASPPVLGGGNGDPVYVNGMTAPDADGMVQIKSVEDFRVAHANDAQASVRNLASGLPKRWFIQDTLDNPGSLSKDVVFQVQTQTNAARTMLSIMGGGAKDTYFVPVHKASQSATGLYKEGDIIADGGAFAGDFVIAGFTVWKGVRCTDVPATLQALLVHAQKNNTINNQ